MSVEQRGTRPSTAADLRPSQSPTTSAEAPDAERRPVAKGRHLRQVLDTEDVVKRVLAPLAARAESAGVELVCEIGAGVGRVLFGDEKTFVRSLVRSVGRALAVTGVREVRVRLVRQRMGFDPGDSVLLSVTSSGSSEEDVHFELPMALAAPDAHEDVARGARVLVVAAGASQARVLTDDVRRCGASATSVRDVDDALHALEGGGGGEDYDVVVLDDGRHLDAHRVLSRLRERGEGRKRRGVVAMTAASLDRHALLVGAGASAVLAKPVMPRELGAAIARVLLRGGAPEPAALPSRRLRLLVAHRDARIADATKASLERLGHEVVTVTNGTKAVERSLQAAFDGMVVDVDLPGLDGLGVARAVRRYRESGGAAPLRIVATVPAKTSLEACFDAGVDAVLVSEPGRALAQAALAEHFPALPPAPSATRLVPAASASTGASARLDLVGLRRSAGHDPALVGDLLRDLLSHSSGWVQGLRHTADAGGFTDTAQLATRLACALDALGAGAAAEAARVVERTARACAAPDAPPSLREDLARSLPELERRLTEARDAARAYLLELSSRRRRT